MTGPDRYAVRIAKSMFVSKGVRCAATIHLPSDTPKRRFPAILMVHGWGGVQGALTAKFYERFIEAGFAVMSFDYAGWGESEGPIRNAINPWQRLRDAEAALAHLKSQPEIDSDAIVLWGTSFGGGHAIDLAAKHPELLGVIAQVPMLDGLAAVSATPFLERLRLGAYAIADLLRVKGPVYIPIVSPPGKLSTMSRDGAYDAMLEGVKDLELDYDNRVTARSILTMGFYRPFKRLKQLRIPTLLVGADEDTVAPFVAAKIRQHANALISIQHLSANHFEPYFEPALTQNLSYQLEFLRTLPMNQW